ncbi:calcium calmodulin-dependent 3-cyclic nucleotide phosphodiesterase 1b [Vairimorpha necatrix]|uniref:Calcium calmodulin-dependent 3-cyclic nucleotide phosphodiesterase 1b n=1 Tax=Vairimorpha necatrix TaxID=6039 RepID=A0AAX4J7Y5_9MICR
MTRMKTREEKEQLKKLFSCYNSILDNHEITQLSNDILSKECDFDQNDLHNFFEAAIRTYNDIPYHNATHEINALYNGKIFFIDQKLNEKLEIGASYKNFDDFMCRSRKLEKLNRDTRMEGARKKAVEVEYFSSIILSRARGGGEF